MESIKVTNRWAAIITRGGVFILIWWVLSDGVPMSWMIGAPAVLLAVAASAALLPPQPFVWFEFVRFIPFFLVRSLLGGVDVAWRAFKPAMPIFPDIVEYSTWLPAGLPQVFLANTISLLPGTLSATLDRGIIRVHVLDRESDFRAEIEAVEQRVARLFGAYTGLSEGGK